MLCQRAIASATSSASSHAVRDVTWNPSDHDGLLMHCVARRAGRHGVAQSPGFYGCFGGYSVTDEPNESDPELGTRQRTNRVRAIGVSSRAKLRKRIGVLAARDDTEVTAAAILAGPLVEAA